MDGEDLVEDVRESAATALTRLGSDKYLVAATGADLTTPAVLRVAAQTAASGRETFDRWAGEESGEVSAAFEAAAGTEGEYYERIVEGLDGRPGTDPDDAVHATLAEQTGTAERVGAGLVGRGLVRERTTLQVVNFFVNEADEGRAGLFREVRSGADGDVETGAALVGSLSDDGRERVRSAAESVIERAYGEYADALESMGVDPKPVC